MIKTLKDFDFKNKRVLVRIDMDVPLDEKGKILDDYRLKKAVPTLRYLKQKKASQIIIIGHIGRPKDKEKTLSTAIIAKQLSKLLNEKVIKLNDSTNIKLPKNNKFVVLENLRFHEEEEKNDQAFAKKLASYAELFVLEAFAVSHRDHASITGIQNYLPACAGFQLEKEITSLNIKNAKKPVVAILGAAKVLDKIKLISKLLKRVDTLILGGAIVFTFYKAKGFEVGKSLVDDSAIPLAKKLLNNKKIILPVDIVVANEISEKTKHETVYFDKIPKNMIGLDIGEKTLNNYKKILKNAKTVMWNGPLGKFETKPFDRSTKAMAKFLATLNAKTIVGGGDTCDAIAHFGLIHKFSHVSTGGGASLQLLQGDKLPGIVSLEKNAKKFR